LRSCIPGIGWARLHRPVTAVWHQTGGVTDPGVPSNDALQDLRKVQPALVVPKDILAGIATAFDVVHRAFIFDA